MKLTQKLLLSMILFLFFNPFHLFANSAVVIEPLKEARHKIVFNDLTAMEKETLARQAQIFLKDLYVHRDQKMAYYENHLDPVPAIEKVVQNSSTMTTRELEESIYSIFAQQRDLHLNYALPYPYSKYSCFFPFVLTRVASEENFFQVRIKAINTALYQHQYPGMPVPEIGDIIHTYDNLPIVLAAEKLKKFSQGANKFGGFTQALMKMTYRPLLLNLVPETDECTFTIESHKTGKKYTVSLPWLVFSANGASATDKDEKITQKDFNIGSNLYQQMFNTFSADLDLEAKSVYPNNPTNEPSLTWGLIEDKYGKFGYLKLKSFMPSKGMAFAIDEIIRIVNEKFKDTDGLIVDVRSNGGGYINLADMLSQLFMPEEAKVIKARLLNSDLNRHIFNNSAFGDFSKPEWKEVINDAAGTGKRYTDLAPFTYDSEANAKGQIYYKPVAVLTNAQSYSATDLFSCAMQDNGAGFIFGEDPKTGAGGANVIPHNLFTQVVGAPFETLPSGHSMRVSWRQSIRFGKNQGKVIEDYGCSANYDISLNPSDLIDGGVRQLKKITSRLSILSKFYMSYGRCALSAQNLVFEKGAVSLDITSAGTDYIQVMVNGKLVDEIPVFASAFEKTVTIDLSEELISGKTSLVAFNGVNAMKKRLWNIKRNVRVVDKKITLDAKGLAIDFATASAISPFTVFNSNPPANGWNLVSPHLQVGYNPTYKVDVDTSAILLLDLTKMSSTTLTVNMAYDTELDYDFIQLFATDNNSKTSFLNTSGNAPMQTYTFDLSKLAGQDNIALQFRFISDSYEVAPGVKISSITVE